jgi:microcystin-dependent protein
MADPFVGEIRIFGFNYAPYEWAACNGQMMPIQQNAALFSLIGTSFGGNGQSTFQLPNLSSRMLGGAGNGIGLTPRDLGETFGSTQVTLLTSEIPLHNHLIPVYNDGTRTAAPTSNSALSTSDANTMYGFGTPSIGMLPTSTTGGSLPHENRQPFLAMTACLALSGVYPAFQ